MQIKFLSFCKDRAGKLFLFFLLGISIFYILASDANDTFLGFVLFALAIVLIYPWHVLFVVIAKQFAGTVPESIQPLILMYGMFLSFGLNFTIIVSIIWYKFRRLPDKK